eukprot:42326_1
MNPSQANIERQSSEDSHSSMEEKLPEQIMENVLLEGVDSSKLLQNADIVTFSNILANLRYDLAAILNEEIDEFQFQTICHDLLSKSSQSIKLKQAKAPNKHQSQQPKPKSMYPQNQIDLDDIYAHLKRKRCTNTNSSNTDEGWNSYLSQVCNHDKRNSILSQHEAETQTQTKKEPTELEPGGWNVCDEDEDQLIDNSKVTLMGFVTNDDSVIKFKTNHDQSDDDNELQMNHASMTLMGHETIQ